MTLRRRAFLHGIVGLPAAGLLAPQPRLRAGGNVRGAAVRNGAELQAALRAAAPGDTITLAPADFGDIGLFELPVPDVTLRAEVPLRSVVRAPLLVAGDRVRILDIAFLGDGDDNLYLSAARACEAAGVITARDVEVARCDFGFFRGRGILVQPSGLRPHIHDCTFHDNRSGGDKNVHEAISLGYDNPTSGVSMRARVTNNRLWNLNVEAEAICVKTSDNLIQGNTILSSRASYSNRYGERNLFQGNTSTNSGGFLIEDGHNHLIGNKISGGGNIKILTGNAPAGTRRNGVHLQATDTYLERNNGPLIVGHSYARMRLPALRTSVKSHAGQITLKNEIGTRLPRSR